MASDQQAEDALLEVLSSLAQQDALSVDTECNDLKWLWTLLTSDKATMPLSHQEPSRYEWWSGATVIRGQLSKISPLELHATAVQAMVFSNGTTTHIHLCLLLCTRALRSRPSTNNRLERWKRWQSLLCETIAIYQSYSFPQEQRTAAAVTLWIDYVLPACRHVQKALPSEAYHTPILAGMVGTTTHLVEQDCQQTGTVDTLKFLKAIGPVVGYRYEKWVWCHPWRLDKKEKNDDQQVSSEPSHLEFIKNKSDLGWWTQHAHCHDTVARMDTSWDEIGVALMANTGFDFRPLVFAPLHVWNLWFPHVAVLLQAQSLPLPNLPLTLLQNLMALIAEHSISSWDPRLPENPIGTFQLLTNRVMAASSSSSLQDNTALLGQPAAKIVMGHMKQLLSRYSPPLQVEIVQTLVEQCPHPGFRPKFIDLLKPMVTMNPTNSTTLRALWTYLSQFLTEMEAYISDSGQLCQVSDLLNEVEVYVAVLTIFQLHLMVKFSLPPNCPMMEGILPRVRNALKEQLNIWSNERVNHSIPPQDYYRLFLLDGVLDQVVSLMNDVTRKDEPNVVMGPEPPPVTMGPERPPVTMGPEPPPVTMGPEPPPVTMGPEPPPVTMGPEPPPITMGPEPPPISMGPEIPPPSVGPPPLPRNDRSIHVRRHEPERAPREGQYTEGTRQRQSPKELQRHYEQQRPKGSRSTNQDERSRS